MKWKFLKGITNMQVDEVGNILQRAGGVIPMACQKCKKKFNSKIEEIPVKQDVPFYKCKNCKFENASGDSALDHKLEFSNHDIKKIKKQRIITTKKIITGDFSHIFKTKNDIVILCGKCTSD